jgi:hypothetical protein
MAVDIDTDSEIVESWTYNTSLSTTSSGSFLPQACRWSVKARVYKQLLKLLKAEASKKKMGLEKGTIPKLPMKVNVHTILLVYHLQQPEVNTYH